MPGAIPGSIQTKELINIEVAGHVISGINHTYAERKGLLALIGSSGYLEVSLNGGSAHAFLNAEVGSKVKIKRLRGINQ